MNDLTVYNSVREQMGTGDAILYRSRGSFLGWAIQKFSDFNHAGVCIRFGPDCYGTDRVWTFEAVGHGICPGFLRENVERYHGEVWWYPLKEEFYGRRDLMLECATTLRGTHYDFKSLIKNILGRVSADMDSLFCSEYWFVVARYGGVVSGDTAPRPGDIPKFKCFKTPVKLV